MHSLGATLQARLAFPAPCSRNAGGRPQLASNPAAACSLRLRRQRGRQRQRSLVHTRAWPAQAAALDLVLHAAETLEHVHSALQSGLLALPLAAAGAVPTPLPLAAGAFLAGLPTALQPSCFSESCQAQKDSLLIASLVVPLLVLAAAVAFLLRPPPQGSIDEGRLFEDESTGTFFEVPEGAAPERDRRGELAFRAISYTPWPVEEGAEGERVRLQVGPVGQREPRTFVFSKVLPQPSQLVVATLERPLGIEFAEARGKRVVVSGLTPGGHAEQQYRRAKLNTALLAGAAQEGDVLRAVTCTNLVYPPSALAFGMQPPKRSIVLYGADGQAWPAVVGALKKGLLEDGPVTLVLERRLPPEAAASGPP